MAINYSLTARLSVPTDKSSEKRIYAIAQYNNLLTLKELSAHIAGHGSPFSKGTIMGILTDAFACIRENLLMGNKIDLGDMGAFYVTISSEGCDSAEDFSASMIRGVNVRWSPSDDFKTLLNDASFQQVATRELQLKSRKEMRQTADEEVKNSTPAEGDGNEGDGNNGNDGGITGGSGQTE